MSTPPSKKVQFFRKKVSNQEVLVPVKKENSKTLSKYTLYVLKISVTQIRIWKQRVPIKLPCTSDICLFKVMMSSQCAFWQAIPGSVIAFINYWCGMASRKLERLDLERFIVERLAARGITTARDLLEVSPLAIMVSTILECYLSSSARTNVTTNQAQLGYIK